MSRAQSAESGAKGTGYWRKEEKRALKQSNEENYRASEPQGYRKNDFLQPVS
jgi:hypothetical protein